MNLEERLLYRIEGKVVTTQNGERRSVHVVSVSLEELGERIVVSRDDGARDPPFAFHGNECVLQRDRTHAPLDARHGAFANSASNGLTRTEIVMVTAVDELKPEGGIPGPSRHAPHHDPLTEDMRRADRGPIWWIVAAVIVIIVLFMMRQLSKGDLNGGGGSLEGRAPQLLPPGPHAAARA